MLKERRINIMSIGRSKLDLKKENASKKLKKKIKNNDVVIFIAAEVPVKNIEMFINNIKICKTVCDTLEKCKDQEEPLCDFSTFYGTHQLCGLKINLAWV